MTATMTDRLTGRSLVAGELFGRLVARIVSDEGIDEAMAARVVDQALAFLGTCSVHRGEPLSPSRAVDPGWHAFVLHTRDYRSFCQRMAGRFIDHVPTADVPAGSDAPAAVLHRTVEAMRQAGYTVDTELWFGADTADCTGCHNGCHDDPPPAARR